MSSSYEKYKNKELQKATPVNTILKQNKKGNKFFYNLKKCLY